MKSFGLKALEKTLNRYLQLDETTLTKLEAFSGKVVALHIKRPKISLYICFEKHRLHLRSSCDNPADVHIHAPLSALIKYKMQKNAFSDLYIEGDPILAKTLSEALFDHDIDWEEQLSQLVGDSLAHRLGQAVRKNKQRLLRARADGKQNIAEFLHEESNLLPPRPLVTEFCSQVDDMVQATDRLDARITNLQQRKLGR